MSNIYTIRFNYNDEFCNGDEAHDALVCAYDSGEVEGETIQYALDKANEDGDFSGVDKLLGKLFGLKDEDICFYFDLNDINDEGTARATRLVPALQKEFNIVIQDIWVEK